MRFYNRQHRHYCGIDLHVKTMYVCMLDAAGQVLVHRNVASTPAAFLEIVSGRRQVDVNLVANQPVERDPEHERQRLIVSPRRPRHVRLFFYVAS